MAKALLSLNVQHEYITLRTPNGNYTYSYGGEKASGKLALNNKAFNNIRKYIDNYTPASATLGEKMKSLTDPDILGKLWPEWNEDQPTPPQVGDMVTAPVMKRNIPGEVKKVSRKYAFIQFPGEKSPIGIAFIHLVKQP